MKCFFYLLLLVIFLCSTGSAKNAPSVHKTSGVIFSQGEGKSNRYQISTKNDKANKNLKRPSPFKEIEKSKRNKQIKTKQDSGFNCATGSVSRHRIYNGTDVVTRDWPSMAAIFVNGKFICGGTVLDKRHILTAAHCISNKIIDNPSGLYVVLGEVEIQQSNRIQPRARFPVRTVYKHKDYEKKNRQHDIAILKTVWPMESRDVSPICLPNGFYSEDKFGKENGIILGWGKTMNPDKPRGTKLQQASVTTHVNSVCVKKLAASTRKFFGNTMICGNNPQQGFCSGDDGGPLFYKPEEGPWLQIGIMSYGMGCLNPSLPGVYTRVTNYLDWIEEQIRPPSKTSKPQNYRG